MQRVTLNFIQLCQCKSKGIGSVWTSSRVNSDSLTVQSWRLHFGFVALVSVLMEKENNPDMRVLSQAHQGVIRIVENALSDSQLSP